MSHKVINYKDILNKVGLRATDERIAVLDILSKLDKPQSIKNILKKLKNKSTHEATLYRTLATFKESGLVRQVDFGDTVPYFEISDYKHDHHHVVCTNCKKVSDFVGCQIDEIIKKALSQAKDFKCISTHSFELFGICNKCSK